MSPPPPPPRTLASASSIEHLPAELLDKIVTCIDKASTVASLSRASHSLEAYCATTGWRVFVRSRFPAFSLSDLLPTAPTPASSDGQDGKDASERPPATNDDAQQWMQIARSLTTLDRAWDRRALQAVLLQPERAPNMTFLRPVDDTPKPDPPAPPTPAPGRRANRRRAPPSRTRHERLPPPPTSEDPPRRQHHPNSRMLPTRPLPRPNHSPLHLVRPDRAPGQWWRPHKQTMGFSPALDTHETLRASWAARRQVLAVGAGAQLLLRARGAGERWAAYRPPGAVDGRDDITAVALLGEGGGHGAGDGVVVGTAAGALRALHLRGCEVDAAYPICSAEFDTGGRAVRCAALRRPGRDAGLLAGVLGTDTLALWSADVARPDGTHDPRVVRPLEALRVVPPTSAAQAWRTAFLSPTTLATTFSAAAAAVQVHALCPTGLSPAPIHVFPKPSLDDSPAARSIYPVAALPGTAGRVFASGGHDGVLRLHDLRGDGRRPVLCTPDTAQYGPIYSVLPRGGGHRVLAGAAQENVLHVVDLRRGDASHDLFLPLVRGGGRFKGPVYALSSPSAYSPFVAAGLENGVVELTLDGALDAFRDPVVVGMQTAEAGRELELRSCDHGSFALERQVTVAQARAEMQAGKGVRDGRDCRWRRYE